jgi:hypothetical protein
MTASRLRAWLCVFAGLLGCQLLAGLEAQTRSGAPSLSKTQWRDDLRHFARELPKRHKNLYHATTKEQFERAVAELDAAIPSLPDHQIIVKMHQIAATVGDGHTGVHLPAYFTRYPINLYWFGRELRVIAAPKEHVSALGARVVKIGGLDIDEVAARIASCFPSKEDENEWYVLGTSPAFLVVPEVLHTLGIVPDLSRAAFTVEDDAGRQSTFEISPGPRSSRPAPSISESDWCLFRRAPLFRQKLGELFWFTHLPIRERPTPTSAVSVAQAECRPCSPSSIAIRRRGW